MRGFKKKSCVRINCYFPCHYHIPQLLPSSCTCLFFSSLPPEGKFNEPPGSHLETKHRKKSYFWSFPDIISPLHWEQIHAFVLKNILIIIFIQLKLINYFSISQWFEYFFVNLKSKQWNFNLPFWSEFPHNTKTFIRHKPSLSLPIFMLISKLPLICQQILLSCW